MHSRWSIPLFSSLDCGHFAWRLPVPIADSSISCSWSPNSRRNGTKSSPKRARKSGQKRRTAANNTETSAAVLLLCVYCWQSNLCFTTWLGGTSFEVVWWLRVAMSDDAFTAFGWAARRWTGSCGGGTGVVSMGCSVMVAAVVGNGGCQ